MKKMPKRKSNQLKARIRMKKHPKMIKKKKAMKKVMIKKKKVMKKVMIKKTRRKHPKKINPRMEKTRILKRHLPKMMKKTKSHPHHPLIRMTPTNPKINKRRKDLRRMIRKI